jgi:ParB-like chromosome segregation protein Spo0J
VATDDPITVPEQWLPTRERAWVGNIDWAEDKLRARRPDLSPASIGPLADSIERSGGLLQPVILKRMGLQYLLIAGRGRLEAYRTAQDRLGKQIDALVYPEDLPKEWARITEIEENEKRQDLTADERAAHSI